ncbi:hypothetical protein ASPCAL11619 [Aspergillus calidoustus]|uniref:Aminoglycoside phosphotransferase domain-containing protein n=1 Tax=Aspergillus calidoustus TaxID=454130 RepID=A0A0U4ZFI1_ASPCI|nr:hypothetical protein ASPCAL11619 [Aspergillus calidoustus]
MGQMRRNFRAMDEEDLRTRRAPRSARFVDKHHGGVPDELFSPRRGSFNLWFRLRFKDGGAAVIRFPIPGTSMFPVEKVQREVAVMKFLEYFTSFRVPHVLHHGMTAESPIGLGLL